MSEHARLVMTLRGRVQGVGMRNYIRRYAASLKLTGFVENRLDRSVHIVAEGAEDNLKQLHRLASQGPIIARVDAVDTSWEAAKREFTDFRVR